MKTLGDLVNKHPFIANIPFELLECVNWETIHEEEEIYTFVSAEDLVDMFIERVKRRSIRFTFNNYRVGFFNKDSSILLLDRFNDLSEEIEYSSKVDILKWLTYYSDESLMNYDEDKKDLIVSLEEYKKLKDWIGGL